ncbi:hypothetical protein BC938DRAFT_479098 [Jimgerdemannia flammicorona]|uniref:Uncharacterized protein n=1 Tax=Jimgerdemannia flammicorona TaxID=994334 RepID=A0A433QLM7_9FUNG|nr:hypothetical protein BC938DRAFT_479098 [Jimgerdemannia flammicorona]
MRYPCIPRYQLRQSVYTKETKYNTTQRLISMAAAEVSAEAISEEAGEAGGGQKVVAQRRRLHDADLDIDQNLKNIKIETLTKPSSTQSKLHNFVSNRLSIGNCIAQFPIPTHDLRSLLPDFSM